MARVERSQIIRKRFIVNFLLFIVFLLLGKAVYSSYRTFVSVRDSSQEKEAELTRLTERKSALEIQAAQLHTPEGKEQVLRDQYNVAKEGEGVIVLTGNNAPAKPESPTQSFFQRLFTRE
jgi:cell division protein FtsB